MQSAREFYQNVKEHIAYVHIKDGIYVQDERDSDSGKTKFTFAGEGNGNVRLIVKDLLDNGYDGGFSMEPHLAVVHHDESVSSPDEIRYANYVEYGRRFMALLEDVRQ